MRGYLMAATEQEYALARDGGRLVLDRDRVRAAIARWTAAGKPFCLLGYTYLLYEHVVRPLAEDGGGSNCRHRLSWSISAAGRSSRGRP